MKISLIRHAETTANVDHILAGWTDVELTESGRAQIKEFLGKGYYPEGTHHFSSDLKRCQDTAKLVAPGKKFILDSELREIHFGRDENRSYSEVGGKEYFEGWAEGKVVSEEGESISDFIARTTQTLSRIIENHYGENNHLIIVTHSGVIRSILYEFHQRKEEFWSFIVKNGLGYDLEIGKDKKIKKINPLGEC